MKSSKNEANRKNISVYFQILANQSDRSKLAIITTLPTLI